MERLDRSKMTCPSTPHFVQLEVIFPENVIFEPRPILLKPTRLTNDGYTEYKYSVIIENRHPPCFGKDPYNVEVDTVQSYHQDGRIDLTAIRVVVLDPTLDKCKVDLTTQASGVKQERQHDERKRERSPPSRQQRSTGSFNDDREVTLTLFNYQSHTYTYLHISTHRCQRIWEVHHTGRHLNHQ